MKVDNLTKKILIIRWSYQEIGTGCGRPFIIIKNIEVGLYHSYYSFQIYYHQVLNF